MKKKVLIWVLAAVLVLSMAGCAAGAVSSNDKYVGMEPVAAAEAAAAETKDTTSISDLIRVPFGYLLDWLYTFTNSYGLALILFSLIVKLVLLPMSVKSKKSMLKMSRLSPQVKALEAKYGDDKQKYQWPSSRCTRKKACPWAAAACGRSFRSSSCCRFTTSSVSRSRT